MAEVAMANRSTDVGSTREAVRLAGCAALPDRRDLKAVQTAYHDWEAATYDAKFGISYDSHVTDYAAKRFRKGLGDKAVTGRILELGGGTGFFSINLALAGLIAGDLNVSDLSPGMLEVCQRNAEANDVAITTHVGDAEALPFDDDSFDLVIGHAFIHHLPVPGLAFREAFRVLRPGGRLLIAGEPTHWGDRASSRIKRLTWRGFMAVTRLPGLTGLRRGDPDHHDEASAIAALEHDVDLHTFHPDEVDRMAKIAGFSDVYLTTEELLANWWGWSIRTIEGSVRPGAVGMRWAKVAFAGYRALTAVDERLLTPVLPSGIFYNLIVSATKPLGQT